MAERTYTSAGKFSIAYPPKRVFAFTPYKISISTFLSQGAPYTIYFNGQSVKRYVDMNSNDNNVPISQMLQSFFKDSEFGDAGTFSGNINAASKLFLTNKVIAITILGETFNLVFDIIWGAIQPGQRETTTLPIYMFAGLPLTVTQNIGSLVNYASTNVSGYGKEVKLSSIAQASGLALIKSSGGDTLKTYNVKFSSCVPADSVYLRWVDIEGEYKYYLLNIAEKVNTSELGASYNEYQMTIDHDPTLLPSLVKNRIKYTEKSNKNRIIAGVMAADDDLTAHLESLNGSLIQWIYSKEGTTETWTECVVIGMSIGRKTREGNRQIDFEIQLPELYNQRL